MEQQKMENVSVKVDSPPALENISLNNEPIKENPSDPAKAGGKPSDLEKKLLAIFAVASGLAIFLWFMVGAGFPWFIYVVYTAALIDCIIYAAKTKNSFFANWTATTNVMLFLTFLACGGGYPWFIFPTFSMAILPVSQYIYTKFPSPVRWLYIHAAIYALINSMLFFTWMIDSLSNPYPWFIYPLCGWGAALLFQYNHTVMHNRSKLFMMIIGDLSLMLLITFRFAVGPLFMIFVLVVAVGVVIYYILVKKGYSVQFGCMKKAPQSPEDPVTQPPLPQFGIVLTPNGITMGNSQTTTFVNDPNSIPPRQYFNFTYPPQQGYQSAPVPGPMYYQPAPPTGPPVYYGYSQPYGGTPLYPSLTDATVITNAPAPAPASTSVDEPASSPSNNVVLTSDVVVEKKDDEEEDGYLLRNSPSRTYSK